jgi:hypothetical protein
MEGPRVLLAWVTKVHVLNLADFATVASPRQSALFSAACVERASGILFWTVSARGRSSDLDRYRETLELLWNPDRTHPTRYESRRRELERMHKMEVGDELVGPPALALYSVVVLHAALRVVATGSSDATLECSMAARNAAFRVERRVGLHLLSAEERCQDEDIASLIAGSGAESIRPLAQQHGRDRLDLAYAKYSERSGPSGALP